MTDTFERGDVVWAPDPFREGTNPRPWLVLVAEGLPYPGEEYVCAALTTSDLSANHEVRWADGRNPDRTSYCSPWVLATVKHAVVVSPQGQVTETFADRMVDSAQAFLDAT